jgi:hypothetical protein
MHKARIRLLFPDSYFLYSIEDSSKLCHIHWDSKDSHLFIMNQCVVLPAFEFKNIMQLFTQKFLQKTYMLIVWDKVRIGLSGLFHLCT